MRYFHTRYVTANSARASRSSFSRGMTMVEILFTLGIIAVLFTGIYGIFKISISVVSDSKARAGALALATERMEQLRGTPYSSVGTVGGIPSGPFLQSESVTLNQTMYTRRTLVQYVDDPADGSGVLDSNGITADYKTIKIELGWTTRGTSRSYSQVSTIVPDGIESLVGGGTLRIQAFDALAEAVSGAAVRIVNAANGVDVTAYTNAQGMVSLPGSPTAVGYQITVTKSGYSAAQTYTADASVPNPSPGHLSVVEGQTTASSFSIDRLASLTIRTLKPIERKTWTDTFSSEAQLLVLASTTVEGGSLTLSGGASVGSAQATSTAPAYLHAWHAATWSGTTAVGASARVHVYDTATIPTLVPDSVLPGNAAGFSVSPIDLSGVASSTYPSLALGVSLAQGSASEPPSLQSWSIEYDQGPVPIANVPFTLRGTKIKGTTGAGAAIYKFSQALTSGPLGVFATSTLEWDTYPLSLGVGSGYDIAEACSPLPISVEPNAAIGVDLLLVPESTHSLLTSITNSNGEQIAGANVELSRSGFLAEATSSPCGQSFFGGLSSGTEGGGNTYTIEVSKSGYQTTTMHGVVVSGASSLSIILPLQ